MANKPANAAQKQWMSDIAEWSSNEGMNLLYDFDDPKGFELHHVLGRSAKHNKVAIGHWFIIPVPYTYHNIKEQNFLNVSFFKHNFTDRFGYQRDLFKKMVDSMNKNYDYIAPHTDIYNAIMDTRA